MDFIAECLDGAGEVAITDLVTVIIDNYFFPVRLQSGEAKCSKRDFSQATDRQSRNFLSEVDERSIVTQMVNYN